VRRTGDIGLVHILAQSASAAGVRRIEALAGEAARRHLAEQSERLAEVSELLKVLPAEAPRRIESLLEERRRLEREIAESRRQLAMAGGGKGVAPAEPIDVGGVKFMGRVVEGVEPKDLKALADQGKKAVGSGVVAFVAVADDGKAAVVVGVTDDLTRRYSAIDLVRAGSSALGGKGGGGRPDMAQAGGPDGSKAEQAVEAIRSAIAG
jgi:alanyl-tRNA synthetase